MLVKKKEIIRQYIMPLCCKLNIYIFWIKEDELLQIYDHIWDKVSNDLKKGFDSEAVYNKIISKN